MPGFTGDDGVNRAKIHAAAPPFEDALTAYLQDRTIDGQPRTRRRESPYRNCPLPRDGPRLVPLAALASSRGQILPLQTS
jgi:hypothetical protein